MKFKLNHISLEVTSDCNLQCRYCYNPWKRPGGHTTGLNSYKKAKNTLKRLFRIADVDYIAFTGGEPFLAERFAEIVLFCRMKKKAVTIISNGTIATKDDYKTMIRLGVSLFEFPLHSTNPAEHDEMTGVQGSWEKSLQSMREVLALGGAVVPVIVITKINYKKINQTLAFLKENGMSQIMLNRYNIGGAGILQPASLLVSHNELRECFRSANSVVQELGLSVTSNVCTPFCLLNPDDYSSIGFGSCSADPVLKPLTLDIEGNLRLCNHSPVVAGNIFDQKFEQILASDYTKEWGRVVPGFCRNCTVFEKCLGGCRAASEQLELSLADVDPVMTG